MMDKDLDEKTDMDDLSRLEFVPDHEILVKREKFLMDKELQIVILNNLEMLYKDPLS